MVHELAYCVGSVAPYYNLVLVIIVLLLFLKLFKTPNKKIYITPWKFLFAALLVFVVEEIITILNMANIITASKLVFPLLETIIITLFIYMLLLQKDRLKK